MCRKPSARSQRCPIWTAIEWHLIGPLQGNKARAAAANFSWVQTVDRLQIAERLAAARGSAPAAAECLRPGQHQRRGQQERLRARRRAGACAGGCATAAAGVARIHGYRRRDRRYRLPARAVPRAACLVRPRAVRRACPSIRCRWACRRTWKPRSPRGARWCASAARCSARVQEKLSRRAHEHHLYRRRQHGARAGRRLDRARRRRRTRLQSSRSTPTPARRSRRASASRHLPRSSPPPS